MAHCEKCIHYDICDSYSGLDIITFFPYNEDCEYFKPTADVVEVRHGKWDWYPNRMNRQELLCTNCEEPAPYNEDGGRIRTLYCPNCGAKMDGKD